jgi:hypothetical protein
MKVERRTYGNSNLKSGILEWELLCRQIRVCLVLSSRVGVQVSAPFTVSNVDTGLISLHRILAADTLLFAPRAEVAVEVLAAP